MALCHSFRCILLIYCSCFHFVDATSELHRRKHQSQQQQQQQQQQLKHRLNSNEENVKNLLPNHHQHVKDTTSSSDEANTDPPNIVILFADNLGYADVGVFDAHVSSNKQGIGTTTTTKTTKATISRTHNIDRLANEGMMFTNWNSAAHLCSASRASLLTGQYPVRTGVYPGVFQRDATYGLMPNNVLPKNTTSSTTTLAEYLKLLHINSSSRSNHSYASSIIGKWHLGHSHPDYLPTRRGFDEWLGIPYHMSGGSIDVHVCNFDQTETTWLPLYEGESIIQQPVQLNQLANRYATQAESFIRTNVQNDRPFFLYMSFSHVHQLCAPRDFPEQSTCQWSGRNDSFSSSSSFAGNASFYDAVEEMDRIAGHILDTLEEVGVSNNTLVLFTSDNGPWVAEQSCAGAKGPFLGKWLQENVDSICTACPHDYVPSPTPDRPRRCILLPPAPPSDHHELPESSSSSSSTTTTTYQTVDGVHCGEDTGLGSVWEANLRMPALARWPGQISAGSQTAALVSTLDVVPTILSILKNHSKNNNILFHNSEELPPHLFDGRDISPILFGEEDVYDSDNRVLFFWRDGFILNSTTTGIPNPLPPPFGRFDVAAVKVGRIKAWFWTKSAHYNADPEAFHDPPLLFDTLDDPGEAHPLNASRYKALIHHIQRLVQEHKNSVDWTFPFALARDPKYTPCVNAETGCRTTDNIKRNPNDGFTNEQ